MKALRFAVPLRLTLLSSPAHAILVDDFEAGDFFAFPGTGSQPLPPNVGAQILWGNRTVTVYGQVTYAELATTPKIT